MQSDRARRRIEQLLDEADLAVAQGDWDQVARNARAVLAFDPGNVDAEAYLAAAQRAGAAEREAEGRRPQPSPLPEGEGAFLSQSPTPSPQPPSPASFCDGRYEVKQFLGEGGKKRVFLALDSLLDREVAFALIKTDGLDDVGRERVRREAQAMGRLGSHPHVVSVFDLGETDGQPYIVTELMAGGDVETLIEHAAGHRIPLPDALRIADQVCQGLEFAHGKGIVHRDLKPGNVWLTADGTAKLGDFGLAVALDRSRLTQAGMMVGTVSYMPPEQAMGAEVSAHSDLYSLGAMLYELVTGRPPFVGDESVAIITQHLNTPPVAPSWHVPEVPAGLEALILRLLEKDAAKRPASAGAVRQMLGAVGARPHPGEGVSSESPIPSPQSLSPSPLYRRIFVGRESELRQLQAAFDAALSGQGSLLTVVGEPGIGKTALCEQLATYAAVRGGKALVGHCYEEGSLSLPYLAFIEAMRGYVLARDPEGLKQDLGSGAAEVARIVSEIRDRLALTPTPPPTLGEGPGERAYTRAPSIDPEEDRWRLYQAVAGFLRNASAVQPLLLILEDLHWADRGTLDLLVFLSRQLIGMRLMIVGNYRDVEVDRAHPLSATLAELRRGSTFLRVPLRGLTADEVQRMMAAMAGHDVAWSLSEAVHRQTEGNPLFVQEVLRYLAEEGLVQRDDGRARRVGEAALELQIPEGLRDVIGRRLSRLSAECNRVLSVAAVIGRDFTLRALQTVVGADEEAISAALEEAERVGVIDDQSRAGVLRFRFAHAFFRQTLYEELFSARRLRLHQQVARALEQQYANRPEEHASELAEHFAQSTDPEDLQKAVRYAQLAAARAMQVNAYGEAGRLLEQALQAQEVLDPDDGAKRCDLLLRLAEALGPAGEPLRAAGPVASEAFGLAEALQDRTRASRACHLALEALVHYGHLRIARTPEFRQWAERADQYAVADSADRALADMYASLVLLVDGRRAAGRDLCRRGFEQARRNGDYGVMFWCAALLLILFERAPAEAEDRLRLAEELIGWPRDGAAGRNVVPGLWISGHVLLAHGRREAGEAVWRQMGEVAKRCSDASALLHPLQVQIVLDILDGRLLHAAEGLTRLIERSVELGHEEAGRGDATLIAPRLFAYLRREELVELVGERAQSPIGLTMGLGTGWALCLALRGEEDEARAALRRWLDRADMAAWPNLVAGLETATLLRERDLAARLFPLVAETGTITFGHYGDQTCVARHLGAAAALLGDGEAALRYTQEAVEAARVLRHRPELALSRLQLAELLLDGTPVERTEALGHLDFAIEEFRAMKMQPALERALRHKGLLGA